MGAGIRAEHSALFLCLEKMELCGECEDKDSRNIAGLSMVLCICQQESGKKATAIFFLMVFLFIVAFMNVSPWLAPFGLVSPDWWCFQDGKMERIELSSPLLFFCH